MLTDVSWFLALLIFYPEDGGETWHVAGNKARKFVLVTSNRVEASAEL
jgi:hypothetical protein